MTWPAPARPFWPPPAAAAPAAPGALWPANVAHQCCFSCKHITKLCYYMLHIDILEIFAFSLHLLIFHVQFILISMDLEKSNCESSSKLLRM